MRNVQSQPRDSGQLYWLVSRFLLLEQALPPRCREFAYGRPDVWDRPTGAKQSLHLFGAVAQCEPAEGSVS
jgi:hypothetical protein